MNFPTRHPLNQTQRSRAAVANADVILGLEVYDFFGVVHTLGGQIEVVPKTITKPGAKLASISSSDLFYKSNYQNFQRYQDVDLSIPADAEATLPALIEAVKRLLTADRKRAMEARGAKLEGGERTGAGSNSHGRIVCLGRQSRQHRAHGRRTVGADQERGLVAGVGYFLGEQLAAATVGFHQALSVHRRRGRRRRGLLRPAALGAAIANKKHGRLSVSIQSDGDLMMANGVLWTAAHHRIPLLTVMHNNRAYHQEIMQLQRMANQHNRGVDIDTLQDRHGDREVRISITRSWRRAWVLRRRDRSQIRKISARRSDAGFSGSRAATRI